MNIIGNVKGMNAFLFDDMIDTAGTIVHRNIEKPLHAGPIQGFFDIPVDHLYAMPVLLDYRKTLESVLLPSGEYLDYGAVAAA